MCWTALEVALRIWGGSGLSQRGGRAAAVTGRRESRESSVGTGSEQTLLFAALPPMVFKGKWGWFWVLAAHKIEELDFPP